MWPCASGESDVRNNTQFNNIMAVAKMAQLSRRRQQILSAICDNSAYSTENRKTVPIVIPYRNISSWWWLQNHSGIHLCGSAPGGDGMGKQISPLDLVIQSRQGSQNDNIWHVLSTRLANQTELYWWRIGQLDSTINDTSYFYFFFLPNSTWLNIITMGFGTI